MANRAPKRTLEDTEEKTDKKSKLAEDPDVFEVRCLIQSVQVGTIIGKAGANIRGVREESNVFISILKAQDGVRERVMTIKGHAGNIALSLHRIGELLLTAQQQRAQKMGEDTTDSKTDFKVQFLVHSSLVGGVIGKGGALVQQTQSSTGARVQVSTEPLPQSSEKTVTVSGDLNSVYAANQIVVGQLKENSLRPGVQNYPYAPSPYYGGAQGGPPMGHYQQAPQYGAPPSQYGMGYAPQGYAPPSAQYGGYGGQQQQQQHLGGGGGMGGGGGSAGLSKQKIVIPTVCAGNVIGRRGTIVANIRQQSGTHISIAAAEPTAPHERAVTISGSPQGIHTAVYMIGQIVEQFESPSQGQPQYQ